MCLLIFLVVDIVIFSLFLPFFSSHHPLGPFLPPSLCLFRLLLFYPHHPPSIHPCPLPFFLHPSNPPSSIPLPPPSSLQVMMHWYMTLRAAYASFRQHHRLSSETGDADILRTHASA